MLKAHLHALGIRMASLQRWELVENLLVVASALSSRNCSAVARGLASARAPPPLRDRLMGKTDLSPKGGDNMFIEEFHIKFMSKREQGRLFDVLRRVSRLEAKAFFTDNDPEIGWPEWPLLAPEGPRVANA